MDNAYFGRYGQVEHNPSGSMPSPRAPTNNFPYNDPFIIMDPLTPEELTTNKLPQVDSASDLGEISTNIHADGTQKGQHSNSSAWPTREPTKRSSTDELNAYDLKPPPPTESDPRCEVLTARLYSIDHLSIILKEPTYFQQFRAFLNQHRPQSIPTLVRYLESQKALTAIRYANALADQLSPHSRQSSRNPGRSEAAAIDDKFENFTKRAVEELVTDALPAYITYRMVTLVTECLVKEITGCNTPLMQDLVQGLAEVYCMSDPKQLDCPIVFASKEFYNTTQYGREYAIGKNCRFLQGPKSQKPAVKRVSNAIHNEQEISEILLNYRRDGNPFLNLVMMAPLHDSRGHVRYYIGAQIDISHLLEGGRGLESFKHLLDQDEEAAEKGKHPDAQLDPRNSLTLLRELGSLLNDEEIEVVRHRDREGHAHTQGRPESIYSGISTSPRAATSNRRFLGMDEADDSFLPPSTLGPNGRLPGVYQNYLLIRPYPSLRIIFTSPALRIPGLTQSKLMDRIGGPQHVREGLLEAFAHGIGVTAKISWLIQPPQQNSGSQPSNDNVSVSTNEVETLYEGRPRWIHCTPLMGSDAQPGVIMVVMVDKEEITGTLATQHSPVRDWRSRQTQRHVDLTKEGRLMGGIGSSPIGGAARFTGSKLYADYLRREGKPIKENGEAGKMNAMNSGPASLHSSTLASERPSTAEQAIIRLNTNEMSTHSRRLGAMNGLGRSCSGRDGGTMAGRDPS